MGTLPTTSSPLGFFIGAPSAQAPPSPLLADNIDPETRDYKSLFVGIDVIDAQVQLAISTVRNSGPAVVEDGLEPTATKMDAQVESRLESDVRRALGRLVRNQDISIIGFEYDVVDEANQFVQARVQYRNLRALDSEPRTAALPLPGLQVV